MSRSRLAGSTVTATRSGRPLTLSAVQFAICAILGLVIALIGVSLASVTGDGRYDAIGSISIGVLLGGQNLADGERAKPLCRVRDPLDLKPLTATEIFQFSHHLTMQHGITHNSPLAHLVSPDLKLRFNECQ